MSQDSLTPGKAPAGMRYMYGFQYVFENPNWFMTVLLIAVCMIIPVVGPIVVLGYQFLTIEQLHFRRSTTYPDFDFNNFSDYLTRGIWPFLVTLIAQLVITPAVLIIYVGGFACTGMLASAMQDGPEGMGGVCVLFGMLIAFAAIIGLSLLTGIVLIPMMLAAGLSRELGPAFDMNFIKDFVSRTWKEMILVSLFLGVASSLLVSLGAFCFCVGAYFAIAVVVLANAQLLLQLYELYLSRGGQPIAIKETPA